MSYLHCPYCEIKENAKIKTHYEALQPIEGKCPDCSAWIDKGQKTINVNGYTSNYKLRHRFANQSRLRLNR